MKTIPLSQGYSATVDDEDFERVNQHKWFVHIDKWNTYGAAKIWIDGKRHTVSLHRFIMESKPGETVDHKDHNGLNNTRANLRNCTSKQNAANRRISSSNTSGYKGVCWNSRDKRWQAKFWKDGKNLHLGTWRLEDKQKAIDAYSEAAAFHNGEFACLG